MSRSYGIALKRKLQQLGLTQYQVAERIGVSSSMVTGWVRGYNEPSPMYVKRLADLGIRIADVDIAEATAWGVVDTTTQNYFSGLLAEEIVARYDNMSIGAAEIGVSQSTLSRWLAGTSRPRATDAAKLAKVGIDLVELWERARTYQNRTTATDSAMDVKDEPGSSNNLRQDSDDSTISAAVRVRFGKSLRKALIDRDLTLTALAGKIKVHHPQISNWLRGIHLPGPDKRRALSIALGMDVNQLLVDASEIEGGKFTYLVPDSSSALTSTSGEGEAVSEKEKSSASISADVSSPTLEDLEREMLEKKLEALEAENRLLKARLQRYQAEIERV